MKNVTMYIGRDALWKVYSADGHCSSRLFSNKIVIGCAESGRSSLQLDDVFLLQALPCQRVSHVLPDDLVHTFLSNLIYDWVEWWSRFQRFQETYHIPSWSQHTCNCAIVKRVSCNCTLEPLLPWDETVSDIRVPHQGPFHINQVLGSQWLPVTQDLNLRNILPINLYLEIGQ